MAALLPIDIDLPKGCKKLFRISAQDLERQKRNAYSRIHFTEWNSMSLILTNVNASQSAGHGSFSANRISPHPLGECASPMVNLDHYRMSDVTFAPHPHAGFSAISYLFEDSSGGLRNRDSLGNDFVVGPGELVWTQAGSGVVHDELPDHIGREVHGLQIFVNLRTANKGTPPCVHRLKKHEIPETQPVEGVHVRIVTGCFGAISSPIELTEPFTLLDISFVEGASFELPIEADWNAMLYSVEGSFSISGNGTERKLTRNEFMGVGARDASETVRIEAQTGGRLVVLSGRPIREEVIQHGPFVMSSAQAINAAIERYQRGQMGLLQPLPISELKYG